MRRAVRPTAVELACPDGVLRLNDVVRRAPGIAPRTEEARQALHLVGVEDVHAGSRRDPEHGRREQDRDGGERGEMEPARARDEEDRK